MQQKLMRSLLPVTTLLFLGMNNTVFAEEGSSDTSTENADCFSCNFSGSVYIGYNTNLLSDHRALRNMTWGGTLNYKLTDKARLYFSSGGYREFENETGTFATDSVLGISRSDIYQFGETGKVAGQIQATIPTSETSRDTELHTALRLAFPISFEALDGNYSITPRVRRNFYEYTTMNGRVLTEWTYSLSLATNYTFGDLNVGASALAGNGLSYKGSRSSKVSYGFSAYSSYAVTKNLSASASVSTSGFYYDAERGTLGDIDLFDTEKVTYAVGLSYSF